MQKRTDCAARALMGQAAEREKKAATVVAASENSAAMRVVAGAGVALLTVETMPLVAVVALGYAVCVTAKNFGLFSEEKGGEV